MVKYISKEVKGMGGSKMKLNIPEKVEIEVIGDSMFEVEMKFAKLYNIYVRKTGGIFDKYE